MKFRARVTSVGESGKKIKKRPYISRISPGASLWPIGTNFGLRFRLVGVINFAKFYPNRLRGSDSMSGQSLTIPTEMRYVAINTAGTNVPAVIVGC